MGWGIIGKEGWKREEDDSCSGSGNVLCPGESSGEGGVCSGDESGLHPDGDGSEDSLCSGDESGLCPDGDGLCSGDESGLCSGEKSGPEINGAALIWKVYTSRLYLA